MKHKSHTGFLIEWECLEETLLVRTRVLFCPSDGWLLSLLLSPCCCKDSDFMLQLWLILALRHLQGPPTIYIAGTTYSKDKTPHTPQCVGEGGHATLVYWTSSLGVPSSSYINAHCRKLRTQALCGVNPQGAKETAVRDLSCQCAFFSVYLNSCGFP